VIRLDNVAKRHGSQILYVDASMGVFKGEKVGLVGPNGAGKSTIFRLITREDSPDEGTVSVDRGVTIGYFDQNVGEMAGRSILAEAMAGAGAVSVLAAELHALEEAMADPDRADELDKLVERFGEVQPRFDELGGYQLEARAREILAGLGFDPDVADRDVGALSGGWKMRVALARILLMNPDALLLDEPTNHLDLESILWLENFLRGFPGAIIMTSHDRELLNRLCTKIIEIDGGEITTYSGNFDFYEQKRDLAAVQHEASYARQQAMLAKEQAFIDRFAARASHAAQVQSRVKKLEKIDKVQPPRRRKVVEFEFRNPPRSGDDVVRLEKVGKRYGQRVVYDGFDFTVRRLERWCVMGINGAGKSTLLKLVAGAATPDAGRVVPGASVKLGYFAQHAMELIDGSLTVREQLEHDHPRAGACAWCWRRCSTSRRTSWSSTSRPTTSISTRSTCSRAPCRRSRARCCSCRTTGASSPSSAIACSSSAPTARTCTAAATSSTWRSRTTRRPACGRSHPAVDFSPPDRTIRPPRA
jgi:ATPase subunit of ABC transporter with duplicated ATPase domains